MLIPLSWLKEYLDLNCTPEQIAQTLTLAGLEVDKVSPTSMGFTDVVVAKVLECHPHPEAERLRVTKVTDGKETYQVVCGAANCREGLTTALARIGAQLTLSSGETLTIKKSKLRGVDSCGMLCSEEELGLCANESQGIIELDSSLPLGLSLQQLWGDTIFEISLTPNLGHCMSILGIARELSALMNIPLKHSHTKPQTNRQLPIEEKIKLSIEAQEDCLRYCARYLENIEVKPTPNWIKERLEKCGLRSVNSVVDITNYILLEYGQPLHAFDYDLIEEEEIIVKNATESFLFETLDGCNREVPEGTLMICDSKKPLAIAGIIGGQNSAITGTSTRILLESAYFHPSAIRKYSKKLNLRTDASSRFEKTVDYHMVSLALDKAAVLIQEVCGGTIADGMIDEKVHPFMPKIISCRLKRINSILGIDLSLNEVEALLRRLHIACKTEAETKTFSLEIPSYRNDIKEEIDIVEEVARMYGYHHILPKETKCINTQIPHSSLYLLQKELRARLRSEGLQEMLCCDLISPKQATLALELHHEEDPLIHVLQPSSVDQSILRPSLLPGLLQAIKHNFDRQNYSISAFEIGQVHFKNENQFSEKPTLGIVLTGVKAPHFWDNKKEPVDIFDLKGIVENVLEGCDIPEFKFTPLSLRGFHPGRQSLIQGEKEALGLIGEVHPDLLQKLDIQEKIFFAQLDIGAIMHARVSRCSMKPLPIYPGSERDWTATFKTTTQVDEILSAFHSISSRLLKQVSLLNLYRSDKLGTDKKNITLRFIYRDDNKTLAFEAAEKEHARILAMATVKLKEALIQV